MRRDRNLAIWFTAVLLFGFSAWVFYPGFLSFDSAYQWYQVRTGDWNNVHPIAMTLIWSMTDQILPGPGGYFLFQMAMYWLGLAVLATGLSDRTSAQIMLIVLLGLFPPVAALIPHLWKDIGMLVALIWTVGLLAHDYRRPRLRLRLAALAALFLACAYRHNALPLAIPLLWYMVGREPRLSKRGVRMAATAALTMLIFLFASLLNRLPGVAQRDIWPVTALWDIAAVSIAEHRMLLPPEMIDPSLTLDELATHFTPYSNVPIFYTGKIRDSISTPLTREQDAALDQAWRELWIAYLPAYIRHRARLMYLLFGFDPAAVPNNLLMQPGVVALADNPPIPVREPRVQKLWNDAIAALLDTPIFSFWLYALVLLAVAVAARHRETHPLLWPVLISAVLYLVPLPLVAPSAEWRYLVWPVFATPLSLALLLFAARSND